MAQQYQYVREVDVVPPDDDIGGGYKTPAVQRPLPRAAWWSAVDAGLLAAGLALAAWIVLQRRSRNWLVVLTIGCLLYFGFYREGCICPIGAIQNVAVALTDPSYTIPVVVLVFFFLPLILALLFGRVFCGGVCPLGGIQDLVLLKPVHLPRWLDKSLGTLKYVYLVLAIWFAVQPAVERDFIICRFDPFVGFFRLTGSGGVLIFGGVLLILGIFVGRPYCRFLCPYGALLALVSRFSWRGVTITPDKELDCGLCARACPLGAIEDMRTVKSSCLYCARCFESCPREPDNLLNMQGGSDAADSGQGMA
ncbi:MAG: 4Fe-4S binding protein [Planctomycetes bacterium]|nr:4Fe-4S binding protein [Planctomycetota bacterium]